jgi:hypothetical protein
MSADPSTGGNRTARTRRNQTHQMWSWKTTSHASMDYLLLLRDTDICEKRVVSHSPGGIFDEKDPAKSNIPCDFATLRNHCHCESCSKLYGMQSEAARSAQSGWPIRQEGLGKG